MPTATARLTLQIPPEQVKEPFFYRLIVDFGLVPNIYEASIDIHTGGTLVLDVEGSPASLQSAVDWLRTTGLEVDARREDRD